VAEVGQLLEVLRALEHEVLEEVREAGPALGLGADAHVVHDRHADHGADRSGASTTRRPLDRVNRSRGGAAVTEMAAD
jgi:hypothetical protein